MKLERHAAILRVIRARRIRNQDELRTALAEAGISATQATLSRDIHELGLVKVSDAEGVFYGTGTDAGALRPDLGQLVRALLVSSDGVGPLLVLRTAAGWPARSRRRSTAPGGAKSSAPSPATTRCWW